METLVLGSGYEPVARVSWRRAVLLLFAGKVEVVESYPDRTLRSVMLEISMPSVVRFLRQSRRARKPVVRFSRENVYARDGARCQYCGRHVTREEATYDHVVPRSHGGPTTWENIVIACVACNQRKGGRTPRGAGMALLSVPRRPATLPDSARVLLTWRPEMPLEWRAWLRDVTYWHATLDEDR